MSMRPANGNGETAARILEAADELFCDQGFDGVSVRDVTRRAGVNKALVFYHFGSKEALFAQVLDRYYGAHRDALAAAFDVDASLNERFHRVMDAYLDFIEQNRRYACLVQRQVADQGAQSEVIERSLAPLLDWTRQVLAEVAPPSGPLAARHFFVTFSGAVINYFTYGPLLASMWGGDPLAPEAVAERRAHLHWLVDTVLERLTATA